MKILITGGTASQIRESTTRYAITLSGLMAKALRERGHEVDVRYFSVLDIDEDTTGVDNDYDFVFVGQSPLKGLGSSYCYCALAAQYRFFDRYAIFTDDLDTRKMNAEWRAALRKPEDFVKPFWQYKKDWQHARRKNTLPKLLGQVETLIGSEEEKYPEVFIPGWTYDLAFMSAVHLSPYARLTTHGVDPSPWIDTDLHRCAPDEKRYWISTLNPTSRPVQQMGARLWSVEKMNTLTWKELESASGLLAPSAMWTPEVRISLLLGVPVVTDWKAMGTQFGGSFEGLAANVEMLEQSELDDLARAQLESLESKSSTREDFPETLQRIIEKTLERAQ